MTGVMTTAAPAAAAAAAAAPGKHHPSASLSVCVAVALDCPPLLCLVALGDVTSVACRAERESLIPALSGADGGILHSCLESHLL